MVVFLAGQKVTAAAITEATQSLVGGLLRTSNDTATSGTTEKSWGTTATLSLYASTTYCVIAQVYWLNSVANDEFFFRIRATSVAGTILNGIVSHKGNGGGPYSTWVSYTFTTTTATTAVYCGSLVRGTGTGTATVQAQSMIALYRMGASGLLTTA
jgi:hypothetical protein